MKNILSIVNGVALVSTIIINYLSNSGALTGNTMSTISDKYFNYFTPEGYAFSIWGLIYLGLVCMVFYTGRGLFNSKVDEPLQQKIGWWFLLSCVANSAWVCAWLSDEISLSMILMIILLISLAVIIYRTNNNLAPQSKKESLFVFIPFGLYFGWISVATIANAAAWLTSIGWGGFGLDPQLWTIVMVIIAGFVNLMVVNFRNLFVYGLVGVWALIAIAVSNTNTGSSEDIIYTCYVVASILFVSVCARYLRKRKVDKVKLVS